MKAVSSLLFRHELRSISTLVRIPLQNTTTTTNTSSSLVQKRFTNTTQNNDKPSPTPDGPQGSVRQPRVIPRPMTMFELYKKNTSWLGYDRHPLVTEPLTEEVIKKRVAVEKAKDEDIKPSTVVDLTPHRGTWQKGSLRVGAIGKKLGSSSIWNKDGWRIQVTLIQISECTVLDTQLSRKDGGSDRNTQMILGAGELKNDDILASHSRHKVEWHLRRGHNPPAFWARFRVTKDALLLPGTKIDANHFMAGQAVQVAGISKDKGFQGVMRRWGMKGQPASHGQTKTHRKMGASGGSTIPGRVFPRKKMPGHMGNKWTSTKSLTVMRVVPELNIIMVKGSIPGPVGGTVLVKDVWWHSYPADIPFPGYLPPEEEEGEVAFSTYSDKVAQPTDPSLEFPPYKL